MKMRPNFDAIHPGTKFIELSIMGESWKKLSDEEKQPYIDLAAEDIERHRREMAAYKAASKPSTVDAGEQKKKRLIEEANKSMVVRGRRRERRRNSLRDTATSLPMVLLPARSQCRAGARIEH